MWSIRRLAGKRVERLGEPARPPPTARLAIRYIRSRGTALPVNRQRSTPSTSHVSRRGRQSIANLCQPAASRLSLNALPRSRLRAAGVEPVEVHPQPVGVVAVDLHHVDLRARAAVHRQQPEGGPQAAAVGDLRPHLGAAVPERELRPAVVRARTGADHPRPVGVRAPALAPHRAAARRSGAAARGAPAPARGCRPPAPRWRRSCIPLDRHQWHVLHRERSRRVPPNSSFSTSLPRAACWLPRPGSRTPPAATIVAGISDQHRHEQRRPRHP